MTDYERFITYLNKTRDVFLYAVGPSVFVPVVAHFSDVVPPGPTIMSVLSSVFVILISIVVFANLSTWSLRRRSRIINVAFIAICIFVFSYFILYQLFVFSPVNSEERIVVGCGYKPDIISIAEEKGLDINNQCPGEPSLILPHLNFDQTKIWTDWSLIGVTTLLFVSWLAILSLITVIITSLICGFRFGKRQTR